MLSKVKLYLGMALSFIFLIMFGWVKYLSKQKKNLEDKVDTLEKEIVVKEKVKEVETNIQKSLDEVRVESERVHNENLEKRNNKVRPKRGDSFNDSRLG